MPTVYDSVLNWVVSTYGTTGFWLGASSIFISYFCWLVAERFIPAEKSQKLSLTGFNLFATSIYLLGTPIAVFGGGSIAVALTSNLGSPLIGLDLLSWSNSMPRFLYVLAILPLLLLPLLITDFFYYWFHRAQHTWPWFWQIHKLHHTDQALNVTTSLRHHWTEEFFRAVALIAPMGVLFKITPAEGGFLALVFAHWGYFIHANLRIPLGWLGLIFGGPQYHRIHHSIERHHWNKNYAAFFPIWDIAFGTASIPQRDEWPKTGVVGETSTPAVSEVLFGPFVYYFRSATSMFSIKKTP